MPGGIDVDLRWEGQRRLRWTCCIVNLAQGMLEWVGGHYELGAGERGLEWTCSVTSFATGQASRVSTHREPGGGGGIWSFLFRLRLCTGHARKGLAVIVSRKGER
jgi:hypothetical protein